MWIVPCAQSGLSGNLAIRVYMIKFKGRANYRSFLGETTTKGCQVTHDAEEAMKTRVFLVRL